MNRDRFVAWLRQVPAWLHWSAVVLTVLAGAFTALNAVADGVSIPPTPVPSQVAPAPAYDFSRGVDHPDIDAPNGTAPKDKIPDQAVETGLGGPSEYVSTIGLAQANPWSPAQAVAWMQDQIRRGTTGWFMRCEGSVTRAYGWGGGWYSALTHANAIPANKRHPMSQTPPAGAIVEWPYGRYGHVGLSLGGGRVSSNDILIKGQISDVPISLIEDRWGMRAAFWVAPPDFLGQAFGRNPDRAPIVLAPEPATGEPTAAKIVRLRHWWRLRRLAAALLIKPHRLCHLNPQITKCGPQRGLRAGKWVRRAW